MKDLHPHCIYFSKNKMFLKIIFTKIFFKILLLISGEENCVVNCAGVDFFKFRVRSALPHNVRAVDRYTQLKML